jgi:hypothetical protein
MPVPQGHEPEPPVGQATIDLLKFREGLRRVVQDPELRNQLENRPTSVFAELGITIPEERRVELADKSLNDLMRGTDGETQRVPEVIVTTVIGVAIVAGI